MYYTYITYYFEYTCTHHLATRVLYLGAPNVSLSWRRNELPINGNVEDSQCFAGSIHTISAEELEHVEQGLSRWRSAVTGEVILDA